MHQHTNKPICVAHQQVEITCNKELTVHYLGLSGKKISNNLEIPRQTKNYWRNILMETTTQSARMTHHSQTNFDK
jgi:hypothetical protein